MNYVDLDNERAGILELYRAATPEQQSVFQRILRLRLEIAPDRWAAGMESAITAPDPDTAMQRAVAFLESNGY